MRLALACALLLALLPEAWASGVYQTPEAFIDEVYAGAPPAPKQLWLTEARQDEARRILGHPYRAARVRYWKSAGRSTWILEEIGKERPITVGIAVEQGRIRLVRVLAFRESRGGEVRHPFFTEQFEGAALTSESELDRPIDGITGATLSVSALTRLARFALYLHGQTA